MALTNSLIALVGTASLARLLDNYKNSSHIALVSKPSPVKLIKCSVFHHKICPRTGFNPCLGCKNTSNPQELLT